MEAKRRWTTSIGSVPLSRNHSNPSLSTSVCLGEGLDRHLLADVPPRKPMKLLMDIKEIADGMDRKVR